MAQPLPVVDWNVKVRGAFSRTSDGAFSNCVMIYSILSNFGWKLNPICGLLGNVERESGYNPWRWESDTVLASTDTELIAHSRSHGYGLFQFTPAGKYIYNSYAQSLAAYGPNFSDRVGYDVDGTAQLAYLDDYGDYIPTRNFPISYADYKTDNSHTLDWLTECWCRNYERPAHPEQSMNLRKQSARYWFGVLSQYDPDPPVPPGPVPPSPPYKTKIPLWMMIKNRPF